MAPEAPLRSTRRTSDTIPVGRLAPSPTGLLHLGHARTFLLAWWHVRSRGGKLWLRLEDLDGPRVKPEMVDAAQRDLEWLGLDWDGLPIIQSRGMDRFQEAVSDLLSRGLAYPCVCTRGDLRAAQSAPQQGDVEIRYPGTCRGRFNTMIAAERATGRQAGIRFRVPEGSIHIDDGVAGARDFDVAGEVGDFLIARRAGNPAYQLAVVVDDAAQGVTEVLRGDDLLSSAARQGHLFAALGLEKPKWFHVPLVLDAAGRRLAKRADDLSLAALREGQVDPRAIVQWVAQSAGLALPTRLTPQEALPHFDLRLLPRDPIRLMPETVDELWRSKL